MQSYGENAKHVCMYAGAGGSFNGRCRDYADIRDMDMPVFSINNDEVENQVSLQIIMFRSIVPVHRFFQAIIYLET